MLFPTTLSASCTSSSSCGEDSERTCGQRIVFHRAAHVRLPANRCLYSWCESSLEILEIRWLIHVIHSFRKSAEVWVWSDLLVAAGAAAETVLADPVYAFDVCALAFRAPWFFDWYVHGVNLLRAFAPFGLELLRLAPVAFALRARDENSKGKGERRIKAEAPPKSAGDISRKRKKEEK